MQTLGQRLRAEREKKALTITELSNRTRIKAQLFEAIEADKPEQFPGRFFYRSFLRQYAELLELPETAVHEEIRQSIVEEQAETTEREAMAQGFRPEVPPLPTGRINVREETRRWVMRLSSLAAVLILCSVVYFVWQHWGQRWFDDGWRAVATRPSQTAVKSKPLVPPPAPPAAATPAPTLPADTAASPTPAETTLPIIADQSASKPAAAPSGPAVHGKIEIQAQGVCWVGGWRDGKQFLSSTMHAGEARVVPGGGLLRLQFGSAGDVAIKVDESAIRPIGGKGEPRTLEYHDGAYRLMDRFSAVEPKP